jgi:cytosine/adenosine deaminase-related metal-dependent hydrolase
LIRYRAAWLLPIAEPPIRDGWIAVDRGRVVALGRPAPGDTRSERDLGSVAVLPGLVNAHTHLELSYLRDEVPPASDLVTWIRGVVAAQRQRSNPASAEIVKSIQSAIDEAVACGTALVGDISNTLVTFGPLTRSPLAAVVFYELIRFSGVDADRTVEHAARQLDALIPTDLVRTSLAAHAPYSVGPLVFRAIRRAIDRDPLAPCSVHLSESAEEVEFIQTGGGPWRRFLEEVQAWDPTWVPPGVSPVQFLDDCGFLDRRVLAVHGVQMSPADLEKLAARGATVVTCPRSNGHTGAGAPPLDEFYASGVRVAVGTDSLASAPDLNVFAELATMRALAPSVPAAALLESATRQGATALGFESEFGTIEPGKRARLIAVAVPPGTDDVEEYLVSGVQPEQIRWVET